MSKIIIGCVLSFLFFGWLPIFVGTFEASDAVLGGILGIIIALLSFAIHELRLLRNEMSDFNKNNHSKEK